MGYREVRFAGYMPFSGGSYRYSYPVRRAWLKVIVSSLELERLMHAFPILVSVSFTLILLCGFSGWSGLLPPSPLLAPPLEFPRFRLLTLRLEIFRDELSESST